MLIEFSPKNRANQEPYQNHIIERITLIEDHLYCNKRTTDAVTNRGGLFLEARFLIIETLLLVNVILVNKNKLSFT